jgi:hypothetical protein
VINYQWETRSWNEDPPSTLWFSTTPWPAVDLPDKITDVFVDGNQLYARTAFALYRIVSGKRWRVKKIKEGL